MIILAPRPETLTPAPDLNLLPFALTPTPARARIVAFFRPRPAPDTPLGGGQLVAAFRGRQVVGQHVTVPKGYAGVVLRASGGPNTSVTAAEAAAAASEAHTAAAGGSRQRYPLTPAASATSTVDDPHGDAPEISPAPSTGGRRKGAGQVALARPRTRAVRPTRAKRVIVDSDGEDDVQEVAAPAARPVKRAKPATPAVKMEAEVPLINVIPATQQGGEDPAPSPVGTPTESAKTEGDGETEVKTETAADLVLPQPPPTTEALVTSVEPVDAQPPATTDSKPTTSSLPTATPTYYAEDGTPARVLCPVARFDSFTLWTADAPLAGFDPDELNKAATNGAAAATEEQGGVREKDDSGNDNPSTSAATGTSGLRRGWWRQGGAGEGGDEFVRALGEWIGLGEIIHAPCYDVDSDDE